MSRCDSITGVWWCGYYTNFIIDHDVVVVEVKDVGIDPGPAGAQPGQEEKGEEMGR